MGFRTRRGGGYRDERGAAVHEFRVLQLWSWRPIHVRGLASDQRIWIWLAAVWSGAGMVAIRERQLVHGSIVWLGLCRLATVGLAAISLRRMGIRAGIWVAVVAGAGIWRV